MNELEDAVVMRIQALFMKEKPSWNLVMYSILQVVDAFYASLQIRCTAHNLRTVGFTKYKITYQKGPTFSFDVYCCTHWVGWRSQRQSEKVNIRNACILPVRAKCGRFCVLMNGRACMRTVSILSFGLQQQSTLRIGRTEVRIHPVCLSQANSLFRQTQKPVRQHGVQQNHRSLAEGITGHTRSSSAAEFSGLCPPPLSQSWGSNRNIFSHAASY